ncbi:hypothetical protein CBM2587_B10234 [Cupriavidus taiwanensis]|uniref:Uncharacterized protein n=1 Tax=Cupriavidus taiwanensis TaxID=164546 RepID=A0A975X575_9BURK|nr:hypothetical protein CBM2587_B10234 [Cupriavidus taiwanensis]
MRFCRRARNSAANSSTRAYSVPSPLLSPSSMSSYRRRSASFCGPTASAARGSRYFCEEGGVKRAIPHSTKGILRLVTIFLIQSLLQHFQGQVPWHPRPLTAAGVASHARPCV